MPTEGLFYSNRRPEDAPFLDTLNELQRSNPHPDRNFQATDANGNNLVGWPEALT